MSNRQEEVNAFAANRIAAFASVEFREIPSLPGYFISNRGHVISAKRKRLKFATLQTSLDGYLRLGLHRKNFSIARLLLTAFSRSPISGEQARHKNGVRHDNRTENLEWGTAKDNADDRTRHGTQPIGMKHPNRKLNEESVRLIRTSKESDRVLSKRFSISKGMIYYIRHGLNWKSVA